MTERLHEQLSGFMDGEAMPESGLAELVRNPELKATWARYHLVRDTLHNELSLPAGDLASRISAAIELEPTVLAPKSRKPLAIPAFFKQAANFAVAASVTVAVVFGVQSYQGHRQAGQAQLAQQTEAPAPVVVQQPPVLMVAPMVQAASAHLQAVDPREERMLDARQQERIRAYLLDHSEQAAARGSNGMFPYVRVVSREDDGR